MRLTFEGDAKHTAKVVYRARPSSFALAREKGLAKVAVGMQLIKMAEEYPRARRTRDACACSSLSRVRNVRAYTALRAAPTWSTVRTQ